LRSPDGTTLTRSSTLSQPTASGERLREHVVALWEREQHRLHRIRLAGVRATPLEPADGAPVQQELTGRSAGWLDLEAAMDRSRGRFGGATDSRGSTLSSGPVGPRQTPPGPPPVPELRPGGPVGAWCTAATVSITQEWALNRGYRRRRQMSQDCAAGGPRGREAPGTGP